MGTNDITVNNSATIVEPELVRRAMQWDEDAFRKLYETTYYRMLYIAKKYMKNNTAAEDVLQEAYIKIWTNLPQLGKPEAYVSWASRIVANTALNELRKNQPTLFSEMTMEGEDGSEMAFDVEDIYTPNQPELSFTDAEEQMIIREMIDSLSDEQRMCVLMYYMEELSVGEIAETLGCSEGTVKSRLNYGRKNIKAKAEELQKKGYNFKGISALAILLLLLGREAARAWAKPVVVSAAKAAPAAAAAATTAPQAVAGVGLSGAGKAAGAAKAGASGAAKAGFFSTVGGKIALIAAFLAVIGGIVFAIMLLMKDKEPGYEASNTTEAMPATTEQGTVALSTENKTESVTEAATEPVTEEVTEEPAEYYAYVDEYGKILAKNKDAILKYERYPYFKNGNKQSVALVNTFGDENPELFFAAQESQNVDPVLHIYTMLEGKAVLVREIDRFGQIAGGWYGYYVRSSKTGDCIYYDWGGGDDGSSGGTTKMTLGGNKLDETVVEAWDMPGNTVKYSKQMSDTERADIGDIILYNSNGNGTDETVLGTSYDDAEKAIKQLQISNYHDPGWQKIDDKWYFYNESGHFQTGWLEDGGKWYYLEPTGEMSIGWKTIKGKTYFFNEKGDMVTGDVTIDLQKYSFDENGALADTRKHPEGDALLREMATALRKKDYDSFNGTHDFAIGYANYEYDGDDVEFAYADLNGDGTDELIFKGSVTGVLTLKDGKLHTVVLFSGAVRDAYTVLADGHILYFSATVASQSLTEYELTADGMDVKKLRSATYDANGGEQELQNIRDSVANPMRLNYHKVSEME